jgi:hypothetical protein
MSISLLRRLLMKEAVKDTAGSSGIMSINKNIAAKVEQQLQRYVNDAMQQGVDLDTLSPEQLKMIVQMNKPKPPRVIAADSPEGRGITEALLGKRGEIIDFPQKRSFKQEVDDMIKDGTITKGARGMKKSKKVQDREMFEGANKRLKTEAQLKKEIEANNKKGIAGIKINLVDDSISKIKSMEPIEAMKEANLVAGKKGRYANLDDNQVKKIMDDTQEHIFQDSSPLDDYATGGRAGFKGGGLTESDYLKVKDMLNHWHDYKKGGGTLSKTKFANAFFRENNADGGVAGLLGERPGYQDGNIIQTMYPRGNFLNIRANAPTRKDYNIQATKDLVENLPGGVVRDVLAPAAAATLSVPYDAIQAYNRMEPGSGLGGFKDAFMSENPFSSLKERTIGAAGPLADRFNKEEDDEYDFSDIEGQTAFVGLPEIFALGTKVIGPMLKGGSASAVLKNAAKEKLKREIGKKIYKGIQKKINKPKYGTKGPTTTTTTKPGGGGNVISGGGGNKDFSVSGPNISANPTGKSNRASQARGYALHGADGGLANFANGGPARQNFKMGKRAFLKAMLGTGAGIAGLKSGLFATGGKEVTKKAVTETVKSAGSGYPPPYFFKLVEKIKFMGDDITQKAATQEREIVKKYKDYEMTEDLGTGDIVIKKRNEGVFYDQDGIISDEYIVYKPGQADELTKGKKPPPEYDEYTVRPDADGKLRDSEDGLDSIDEILEEVGDSDSLTLKKASGGIARMLGE